MPAAALAPGTTGGYTAGRPATGFYGKLPDRGDFVQRRLPAAMVAPWDAWLREGLAASRAQLGEAWTALYLTFPIWRFALSPGLCGTDGLIGLLLPSVDSVARAFPLTVAVLTGAMSPARAAESGAPWFAAAEPLALDALREPFELDTWDAQLAQVAGPSEAEPAQQPGRFDRALLGVDEPASLWWTEGSDQVGAAMTAAHGLPDPAGFCRFLSDHARHDGPSRPCASTRS